MRHDNSTYYLVYMDTLSLLATADGSVTFWSETFQETFHSTHGAKNEAEAKFVIPTKITEKARMQTQLNILDVCYGLGYNSNKKVRTKK